MDVRRIARELGCALGLKRKIVAVKFLFEEDAYQQMNIPEVRHKLSYCSMVKRAAQGGVLKADLQHFLCVGSAKALGLMKPDAHALSGSLYHGFGLYDSLETARKTQSEVTVLSHEAYGVAVMPLETAADLDVAIILSDPYQGMRLIQGYAHAYGAARQIKMVSNSGICSECTATPYATGDINVSLLCSNTRFGAKWRDDELGVGVPAARLEKLHEGVLQTIGPCETAERKVEIAKRFEKAGLQSAGTWGDTYFLSAGKPRV